MPLNTTDAELRTAAAVDLAEKLRLESRQITELRELFRNMAEDMEAFVAVTGEPPRATIYEDDWRGLLARQARRVSNEFSGQVTDFLEEAPEDESIIEELAIIAALTGLTVTERIDQIRNEIRRQNQAFVTNEVTTNTRLITATNQREMDAAVLSSRAAILDEGRTPTNAEVASTSSRDFRDRGFARSPTIASTLTQQIAEGVKHIEIEELLNARNGIPAVVAGIDQIEEDNRRWITVGDERVRSSHRAVDFQKAQDGGWVVQGEFLRFPGDPFRGSASNIINCRCSAQPVIE